MEHGLADFAPFAVSLALGALVGIEREHSQIDRPSSLPGGIRTFPLIALLGCMTSWLGAQLGMVAFGVVAAGFFALVTASYIVAAQKGASGITTALASLLTFVCGIMAHHDNALLAAALAVATTTLLSLRRPLHQLTSKVEDADLYSALKLAAITVIVLPLLPDRSFGEPPLDVLNPFRIWLLVVLVGAVGFLGYVGVKALGPGRGIVAAGTLGGLVSSTATTYTLAGRSRETPELSRALALGIALAWATMCGRLIVLIGFINAGLLTLTTPPLLAAMAAGVGAAFLVYLDARRAENPSVPYTNPFSVWSAIRFGAIFSLILLAARFAQVRFQNTGVLVAAALSGTVDVDAISLTVARLSSTGEVSREVATLAIAIAAASNTIVKALLAFALGSPALRRAIVPALFGTLAAGGGALFFVLRG